MVTIRITRRISPRNKASRVSHVVLFVRWLGAEKVLGVSLWYDDHTDNPADIPSEQSVTEKLCDLQHMLCFPENQ